MRNPIAYLLAGLLFTLVLGCGGCESESMEESKEASAPQYLAYFGTYTKAEGGGEGIYAWRFDSGSGQMTEIGLAAQIVNPSFVAVHPNHQYLYAVTEDFEGEGAVSSFQIDHETGKLTLLNQVSSKGSGPCHLNLDSTGRMLAVANYGAGSTASFQVNADGNAERSGQRHATRRFQAVNEQRQQGAARALGQFLAGRPFRHHRGSGNG